MDEIAARAWLDALPDVSRETHEKLDRLVALLAEENAHQNLLSASTIPHILARHIVDSAQLIPLANRSDGRWLDLGSGAGLPGLVIATLVEGLVTLVESRRLRCAWLSRAVDLLDLTNVRVEHKRLELLSDARFDVITARAFAPLPKLFTLAHRFCTEETLWILPKGRGAAEELESVADTWHGVFHMETSVTDPDSAIIVARNVRPKGRRR
ncbi:MAG: 16S rRNA (guanine(527)-N(7))-methyltransferase RsmG [Sphingomonadales bacterium]